MTSLEQRVQAWGQTIRGWRALELREVADWPLAAQRSLLLAVALSVWTVLGMLLGWPMWQEMRAAQAQSQQLQSQTREQATAAADWPQVQQQHAQAQAQWRTLQQRFPSALQVDQALVAIDALARQHHIHLQSVRVQAVQRRSSHMAQPIRIEAKGDYHDWGRWMAALAGVKPLIWVTDLDAQADDARGVTVKVSMTLICAAQPAQEGDS